MIEIGLILSVVLNLFLFWYIAQLISRLVVFQEEIDLFSNKLDEYRSHVDILYNMERFFGDETLANLLRHSKAIVEECKGFQYLVNTNKEPEEEEYGEEAEQ